MYSIHRVVLSLAIVSLIPTSALSWNIGIAAVVKTVREAGENIFFAKQTYYQIATSSYVDEQQQHRHRQGTGLLAKIEQTGPKKFAIAEYGTPKSPKNSHSSGGEFPALHSEDPTYIRKAMARKGTILLAKGDVVSADYIPDSGKNAASHRINCVFREAEVGNSRVAIMGNKGEDGQPVKFINGDNHIIVECYENGRNVLRKFPIAHLFNLEVGMGSLAERRPFGPADLCD